MARLARDVRGNTLAIGAAAMIPLIGMVGGGIDLSRMYIVKTRLQHACDAGALAGRKAMGGGTWAQSNYAPRLQAERFFNANIAPNAYGSNSIIKAYSETAGKVSGTASAVVPMTLMRVLGRTQETVSVACDAEMRLPNTDIMFVLDTTGSMARPIPGDSDIKIDALKKSVKCFFEIVARLDTDAECSGGAPSGGTGDQVQIRFGFVPYSTNVNVGRLLKPEWMADNWYYQSRWPSYTTSYGWVQTGQKPDNQSASRTNVPENYCTKANAQALYGQPYRETESGNTKTGTQTEVTNVTWTNTNGGTCSGVIVTTTTTFERRPTGQTFSTWNYGATSAMDPQAPDHQNANRLPLNGWTRLDGTRVPGLKNSDGTWASGLVLPIGNDGADRFLTWDGCVEERQTVRTTSYTPIPTDAKDLDLELTPSSADVSTQWGPVLRYAIFQRSSRSTSPAITNTNNWSLTPLQTNDNGIANGPNYFCPTAARKLQSYDSATDFDNYVDSLRATGNTYHDIGLLWGARLMWPTGLFRSENEYTDRGGEIDRHIIFMTDGETETQAYDYTAYGLPWFDRRQTSTNSAPNQTTLNDQVNRRFAALCTAIKNNPKGITLWVINFGNGTGSATKTRLQNCATSPDYFFDASDSDELEAAFRKIADDISQLRLTK
ncbi:pilus assembly protein [Sphingomonas aracearum]|nr:TadE/TadG family type IV pilus assembly protein [Sphingomonas aracearum]